MPWYNDFLKMGGLGHAIFENEMGCACGFSVMSGTGGKRFG